MATSKINSPFTHVGEQEPGLTPSHGRFNSNSAPSVNKPADMGAGDVPLLFEHKLSGTPARLNSPFKNQEMKTK